MANVLNDSFEDIVLSYQQLLSATDAVKNTLTSNRDLTKQIIRQNTARLLETLRSRESWLLDQADLLCQSKIDLLQDRRELINRAIGCYDNVKIDSIQGNGLQVVKNNLKGQINKIEAFINSQQELAINGCIKFYGGTENMIKQLNNFGKVDACSGQSDCQCFNYVKRVALETPLMRKMNKPTDSCNQSDDTDKHVPTAIEECIPRIAFNSGTPDRESYQMKTYDTAGRKRKNCCNKTCSFSIEAPPSLFDNRTYKVWLQSESSVQEENKTDDVPLQYNHSFANYHHEADVFPTMNSSHGNFSNFPQHAVVKSDNGNDSTENDIWLVKRDSISQNDSLSVWIANAITVPPFNQEDDVKKWLAGSEENSNKSIYNFKWEYENESIDRWCIKYNRDTDSEHASSDTFNFPYNDNYALNFWLAEGITPDEWCRHSLELMPKDQNYQLPEIAETNINNNDNNNDLIDVKENDDSSLWLAKPSFAPFLMKTESNSYLPDDVVQYFKRVLSEDSSKWLKNQYLCNIETIIANDESNAVTEELQYLSLSSNDQQLHAIPKEHVDFSFNWDIANSSNMHLWLANF